MDFKNNDLFMMKCPFPPLLPHPYIIYISNVLAALVVAVPVTNKAGYTNSQCSDHGGGR